MVPLVSRNESAMIIVIKDKSSSASEKRVLSDDLMRITIGRSVDCALVLPNHSVSRYHAEIVLRNGKVYIYDVGSSGGTRVDGVLVSSEVQITSSSVVNIGPYELCLEPVEKKQSSGEKGVVCEVEKKSLTNKRTPKDDLVDEFKDAMVLYTPEMMDLAHLIHVNVLEKLNLSESALHENTDSETLINAEKCLDEAIKEHRHEIPSKIPINLFRQALLDELTGYGPITPLIRSSKISEIMVNGPDVIFIESKGRLYETGLRFMNDRHLMSIIQRIVEPLGRHIDDASPMVDARLPDGSRVNAVIRPLSLKGASLTIRKFADKKLTVEDLIGFDSLTREMASFLKEAVLARKNILVSGGTGSGKTTLLNVLSLFIPDGERVITVEDSAELKLTHRNLVTLEARPANIEGKGRVTIRDLVVNTLRMRPDRIIIGECRGAEALDMLQAMNTGHDGSLTTCHANTPRDALSRLENMVMMAGMDLPSSAIREQVASAIDIIVQQTRLVDGSRKIVKISEVTGREESQILMQDIFVFEQTGVSADGVVEGYHTATGNIPGFIDELRRSGRTDIDMSLFVPKV